MHPEVEKLIDHSFEYAQELLVDTKEFYPFGAFIDTIGNVHPLEFEFDAKNMPKVGAVLESLSKYCETEMSENKMKGYALTFESIIKLDENSKEKTCITLKIKHSEENDIPDFYQAFEINEAGEVDFEPVFGVKK
ncbi:hypothetical protein DNU06_07210 [Putridiphycobacter roseus]|uniref:Uncharacterized protein n=1 Tax=Putridiphycobacter roseus TaxID=2219161 RepID=A0A2W1N218_9FLAO|nr:hypothetical protein [Putridiphycobacter roseus]PZE17610.1 hypothetical protein DNU06_07210 [Putridiphycobacter roseus]